MKALAACKCTDCACAEICTNSALKKLQKTKHAYGCGLDEEHVMDALIAMLNRFQFK